MVKVKSKSIFFSPQSVTKAVRVTGSLNLIPNTYATINKIN